VIADRWQWFSVSSLFGTSMGKVVAVGSADGTNGKRVHETGAGVKFDKSLSDILRSFRQRLRSRCIAIATRLESFEALGPGLRAGVLI
jgi:hypothetical protein